MDAYILNVFIGEGAVGNPAAAVKLRSWLPECELKEISQSLRQPVTSFIVSNDHGYDIRWFAGEIEINLCGHGSLAAAAAVYEMTPEHELTIPFVSQFGTIIVNKCATGYTMTMPSWKAEDGSQLEPYGHLLGLEFIDIFSTRDLIVVLDSEQSVRYFKPDFNVIKGISDYHAVIVTAQNGTNGYILRYFAPSIGIDEDIATGSAQYSLGGYWSSRLNVNKLEVNQLSAQGGYFQVSQHDTDFIELKVNVLLQRIVNLNK